MNKRLLCLQVFTLSALIFLSSCTKKTTALNSVLERGEIVVLTRSSPISYNETNGNVSGLEYELVTLFAEKLGVKARFILPSDFKNILKLTPEHEADFAAAGLSITLERQKTLLFTPSYYEVTQQLIYHYRTRRQRSVNNLNSSFFEVLEGSSHAENLQLLKQSHPSLDWIESNASPLELLSMVNDGLLDYTITDSNQFQIFRDKFPKLNVAFNISKPEKVAWAFPKSDDHSLYNEAVKFLAEIKNNGLLEQLQDKYFGHSKNLSYVGICTFRRHVKSRLPKLKPYFKRAAEKHAIDWRLLAAVAYQESHWNKNAVSPTGVRGVMMLTNSTAEQLDVTDRQDPGQSIEGGARYLFSRIQRIPERINNPDRTWMALASYNIGLGHLEDARVLTQQQGSDPDKWVDVRQHLPLLEEKTWYQKTKYGRARGQESVVYVRNVRKYFKQLSRLVPDTPPVNNLIKTNELLNIELPAL
tara:strand:- start:1098 stop:2513 length:1416 start_codon:yes stop_codon:yes gene_type:complete